MLNGKERTKKCNESDVEKSKQKTKLEGESRVYFQLGLEHELGGLFIRNYYRNYCWALGVGN